MANYSLHLDPTFFPIKFSNPCNFEIINFPSGFEPHIRIGETIKNTTNVIISLRLKTLNDLFLAFLATDALRRLDVQNIHLFLPFVPFARQDRVVFSGEPLSIKVVADLINLQNYKTVTIYDPHSDVTGALINNCKIINNYTLVAKVLLGKTNYRLVSPDAGAYKKIFNVNKYIGESLGSYNQIVICDKVRDQMTGKIVSTTVNVDDLNGDDVYIVDDILDGGRTFIEIAKELDKRNCGDKYSIISHYFGTNGEDELKKYFKNIFTTDSIKNIQNSDFIKQINLYDLI